MEFPLFFSMDPVPLDDPIASTRYSLPASNILEPVITSLSLYPLPDLLLDKRT